MKKIVFYLIVAVSMPAPGMELVQEKKPIIILKNGDKTYPLTAEILKISGLLNAVIKSGFSEGLVLKEEGILEWDLTDQGFADNALQFFVEIAPYLYTLQRAPAQETTILAKMAALNTELKKVDAEIKDLEDARFTEAKGEFQKDLEVRFAKGKRLQDALNIESMQLSGIKEVAQVAHETIKKLILGAQSTDWSEFESLIDYLIIDKTPLFVASAFGPLGVPAPFLTLEHNNPVAAAVLSGDDSKVITASGEEDRKLGGLAAKTVTMWDIQDVTNVKKYDKTFDEKVNSIAFSYDSKMAIIAVGTKVIIADISNFQNGFDVRYVLTNQNNPVQHAAFSHDDKKIMIVSGNRVDIWQVDTLAQPQAQPLQTFFHESPVVSAAFSHKDTQIITASNNIATIWDLKSWQPWHTFEHWHEAIGWQKAKSEYEHQEYDDSQVYSAAFSHDDTKAIVATADAVIIWDIKSEEEIGRLGIGGSIMAAEFNRDDTKVIAFGHRKNNAHMWDIAFAQQYGSLRLNVVAINAFGQSSSGNDYVTSAHFNRNGTKAITSSTDKTATIWANAELSLIQINLIRMLQGAKKAWKEQILALKPKEGERSVTVPRYPGKNIDKTTNKNLYDAYMALPKNLQKQYSRDVNIIESMEVVE